MPSLRKAEKHIAKHNHYLQEAESAMHEARAFGVSSVGGDEVGINKDAQRMIKVSKWAAEKAQHHAAKAARQFELLR